MADSFFGFDTSLSNLNDDEGGGEPSEDEYDALNDETFGQEGDGFDWEVEHEHLAGQLESSRRHNSTFNDSSNSQLEASLSQLVLDETDSPQSRAFGSSVWRHDLPFGAPTPVPTLKNVCTVEELERQLRQKQHPPQQQFQQNLYQPRFPPVILQRPPGLPAPVTLPFAPNQTMSMNQQLNKIIGQNNPMTQMTQSNILQNQMGQNVNQMGQNVNQLPQNLNQLGPNVNQLGQNVNQMGQNQFMQNASQMNFPSNQMGQNSMMKMSQNMPMGQSNQLMPNQMGQNVNHLTQNQMVQNVNQMGQNVNQMMPNGNQFNHGVNQFQHMMGQARMIAPPPGINMPRQNFNSNMGPFNPNFRGPQLPSKPNDQQQPPMNPQNMFNNQQLLNQQIKNPPNTLNQKQNSTIGSQINQSQLNQSIGSQMNQPIGSMNQSIGSQMNQSIGSQLNQSMGSQLNQSMGSQLNHSIGSQINQSIGSQLNHSMGSQMNQPMGSQLNQSMGQQMNQSIGSQSIGTQMNQSIGSQMNQSIGSQMNQSIGSQMNQSPQNKVQNQNKVQSSNQNQRVDPKMQKSRVYNNSKNLTSQNLVQLIQNTHPMLNFNNSFHNASHHPILNNRNSVFNNQFVNTQMFNNQRVNGTYSNNNRSMSNGDDASTSSDGDEYAGLMTQREKQWLINIQMLQLNTGTPYIHDFYYTVFLERQASKEKEGVKEAHKANQQNHPFYSGGVKQESHTHTRERHNSNRHNSSSEDCGTPRTYVPTQFENSLGKLQCGSVTAPRKIIDVEVVAGEPQSTRVSRAPSVASTTNPAEVPREMKRTKQLLLDIEALYLILLRLEELNDPLAISNALILKEREEKQKQLEQLQREAENDQDDETNVFLRNIESVQRRPKQESPKSENIDKRQVVNLAISQKPAPVKNLLDEDKDTLVNKMFIGLLHSDKIAQMLTVRKGRTLLARFVSRVPASHVRMRALWSRVLRALSTVCRRDTHNLSVLAPHYRSYIQTTTGWSAVLESCSLLSEALDPARTPYALTSALTLSCVCALIERASVLVNTPETTSNERQWSKFLKTLARALKNTTLTVAKPCQHFPETKLVYHLKQLESRSPIEILQRGKSATEFADISKVDVMEQLVKHLC